MPYKIQSVWSGVRSAHLVSVVSRVKVSVSTILYSLYCEGGG